MRNIAIIIGLVVVVGGIAAYMMYNKPHQDMQAADADIRIESHELLSAFENDEAAANAKYLDKVVQVSGTVASVQREGEVIKVILETGNPMSTIICELDPLTEHKRTDFQPGEQVTFKGLCTGMLMDVVMARCVEVS